MAVKVFKGRKQVINPPGTLIAEMLYVRLLGLSSLVVQPKRQQFVQEQEINAGKEKTKKMSSGKYCPFVKLQRCKQPGHVLKGYVRNYSEIKTQQGCCS